MCFGGKSGTPDWEPTKFGKLPSLLRVEDRREIDYKDRPEPEARGLENIPGSRY